MQSRILVALAVIGCLYAAHAEDFQIDDNLEVPPFVPKGPTNQLETQKLLRLSYHKFFTLLDTLTETEIEKLREYMTEFVKMSDERMLRESGLDDEVFIEKVLEKVDETVAELELTDFVKKVYVQHAELISYLSKQEIEKLREICVEFVDDANVDLMHYIETGYDVIVKSDETEVDHEAESSSSEEHDRIPRDVVAVEEERSIKDLLKEVIRKLRELRERVWANQKVEVTNAIIKIIKRADEELIKNNHKEEVDQMLARTPYEKLSQLTLRQLSKEAGYRAEALLEILWEDKVVDIKSALVHFLDVIEKKTAELNQSRIE